MKLVFGIALVLILMTGCSSMNVVKSDSEELVLNCKDESLIQTKMSSFEFGFKSIFEL